MGFLASGKGVQVNHSFLPLFLLIHLHSEHTSHLCPAQCCFHLMARPNFHRVCGLLFPNFSHTHTPSHILHPCAPCSCVSVSLGKNTCSSRWTLVMSWLSVKQTLFCTQKVIKHQKGPLFSSCCSCTLTRGSASLPWPQLYLTHWIYTVVETPCNPRWSSQIRQACKKCKCSDSWKLWSWQYEWAPLCLFTWQFKNVARQFVNSCFIFIFYFIFVVYPLCHFTHLVPVWTHRAKQSMVEVCKLC